MKKLLLGFLLLAFFDFVWKQKGENGSLCYHCGNGGFGRLQGQYTLQEAEVKEEPKPMVADELFDDFIFNYASDDALQRQRTVFLCPIMTVILR